MFIKAPKEIYRLPFPGASRPLIVTEPQLLLAIFTVVAVVILHWFLTRSRLGKAMRAVSDNPDLTRITGINTNHVVWATWIIGGALACAAGSMLSMDVNPEARPLLQHPATDLRRDHRRRHRSALWCGFLVGFCETLAVFTWAILLRPFKDQLWFDLPANMALVPTQYKLMVPFLILIIVLIYRPTGILKGRVL